MNRKEYIIAGLLITTLFMKICHAQFSLHKKMKSFIHSFMAEKIEQKELSAASIQSLSLTNANGSITIKTGPKKSIFLRSIKHAHKEAILDDIAIIVEKNNNHVSIMTQNQ